MTTTSATDISAFRTFLEQHRGALNDQLACELRSQRPELSALPEQVTLALAESHVDAYLANLEHPDIPSAALVEQLGPMIRQQGEITSLLRLIIAYHRYFVDYALEALALDIPGAAAGMKALTRQSDAAILWITDFYHSHLREGMQRQSNELRTTRDRLDQSFLNTPLATIEWDASGTISFWNPSAERIFGWTAAEALGQNIIALLVPDIALAQVQMIVDTLLEGTNPNSRNLNRTKAGQLISCQWYNALLRDEAGNVIGALSQTEDISDQVRNQEERGELQQQVIEAQAAALRELSTPLIPLANGVVAMPLIGSIDTARAQQVLEDLLTGVAEQHARVAILDITGVPIVDTQVANVLLQAAQAVRLLGAQVILTGIRPEVAQTLVGLGVDLRGIVTLSTLQSGITYAFNHNPARV